MACFRASSFLVAFVLVLLARTGSTRLLVDQNRPNIVWIVLEDK